VLQAAKKLSFYVYELMFNSMGLALKVLESTISLVVSLEGVRQNIVEFVF